MWIGIIIIIVMAFLFPVFIVLSIKSVERGGRRRSFEDNDGMSPLSPNAYVMPGTTLAELQSDDGICDEVSEQKFRSIRVLKGFVGVTDKITSLCDIYMEYRRKEDSLPAETASTERKICMIRMQLVENETVMRVSSFYGARKTARATVIKLRKELAALRESIETGGFTAENAAQMAGAVSDDKNIPHVVPVDNVQFAPDNNVQSAPDENIPSASVITTEEPRLLQNKPLLDGALAGFAGGDGGAELSEQEAPAADNLAETAPEKPSVNIPKDDFYIHRGNYNESGESDDELKKRRGF